MFIVSKADREKVVACLRNGKIDGVAISDDQLVDEIIRVMNRKGYLQGIKQHFPDVRKRRGIPFEIIMALAIAAKMKVATSLADIPYAITNMHTLQEIGYILWEAERSLSERLMDEGSIRYLVGAYKTEDWVRSYIRFGGINAYDLTLSRERIENTRLFQHGDKLVNDRGFISRDMLNYLKRNRGVDTYIPLRKGMDAYNEAIRIAIAANKWSAHPNKKRKTQKIALAQELGVFWRSEHPDDDVEINGCVVQDHQEGKDDEYYVFVTTATKDTAKQIIMTYELRLEIEEDYRQIKSIGE